MDLSQKLPVSPTKPSSPQRRSSPAGYDAESFGHDRAFSRVSCLSLSLCCAAYATISHPANSYPQRSLFAGADVHR
ncbi:hypothetical protein LZ31DRAFT_556795, partial [Colletotrichum somersetense]